MVFFRSISSRGVVFVSFVTWVTMEVGLFSCEEDGS